MITKEALSNMDKDQIEEAAKSLDKQDIILLLAWLSESDDKIRYPAFQILQRRSATHQDLYPFWDMFDRKLTGKESYQRSIGLMLIAENTKWDVENKMEGTINEYLMLLEDKKPVVIRQCIQYLKLIIPYKKPLHKKIIKKLIAVDIPYLKDTMQKLVLMDVIETLMLLRKYEKTEAIDDYISNALEGDILDKYDKKIISAQIQELDGKMKANQRGKKTEKKSKKR